MDVEELISLSKEDISTKLGIPIEKAWSFKHNLESHYQLFENMLKHLDVLTDSSLTNLQAAEKIGKSKSTVDIYRHNLRLYDLIKPKKKGRKLGSVKKLCKASYPNRWYVNLSKDDIMAAKLNPEEKYSVVIKHQDGGFYLRALTEKEKRAYLEGKLKL